MATDYTSKLLPVFRANVRRVMRERSITQEMLAERLGVQQSVVSKYLSDSDRSLYIETLERIAEAIEVPVEQLLVADEFEVREAKKALTA